MAATWHNRKDAAELIGETVDVLDKTLRPMLPVGSEMGRGASLRIHCGNLVQVWCRAKIDAVIEKASGAAGDDAEGEMGGPPSQALERFRAARAEMVELELAERKKVVIPMDDAETAVRLILQPLAKMAETLQRRFGAEAFTIVEHAVSQSEALLDEHFGRDEGSSDCPGESTKGSGLGQELSAAEVPHDAAVRRADDHPA